MEEVEEIAAWLRKQAETDLARAKAAGGGTWRTGCECKGECAGYPPCERVEGADITIYAEGGHDAGQAAHIAAHDPRGEIARAESVLAVLGECGTTWKLAEAAWEQEAGEHALYDQARTLKRTVRRLARGYRYREGWQDGWGAEEAG